MTRIPVAVFLVVILSVMLHSCAGERNEVKIMTLDPGHFHAALVQKSMYDQVSPTVHVYAPEGADVMDHQMRIDGFNSRTENPTSWKQIVHVGTDYLEKMIEERPGNVVVISGNNRKKAEYILACVKAGLHVLADKPMCIDRDGFRLLEEAFGLAEAKGVLVYDIMTERFEITSILQKELANDPSVLGEIARGTPDDPAVIKESVHHFFKHVAGQPLKRPPWFFDTTQQGEGIVDVTTHLIDLVMWGLFPGEILDFDQDLKIERAKRWPTMLSKEQFRRVTRLEEFPDYLAGDRNAQGEVPCYSNGELVCSMKGIHARISVRWNYEAPEGGGDTHYSLIRGSKSKLIIMQGEDQGYRPELYVEAVEGVDGAALGKALSKALRRLSAKYPGVEAISERGRWHVVIPDEYRIGHEAHFRQVTEAYLGFLERGMLPVEGVPNMITKYRITTGALAMATRSE